MNRAGVRAVAFSAFLVASVAANAALIYDNGPLVTHAGQGSGGADASVVQDNSLGMGTLGVAGNGASGQWVADDFSVGSGETWDITGMTFFAYQTDSGTTSTMTALHLKIYLNPTSALDPTTGTLVFGDDATNRLARTSFTNDFRTSEDIGLTNTRRPIMNLDADFVLSLTEGHYVAAWNAQGSAGNGPWVPVVTILGQDQKPGSNASAFDPGFGWYEVLDAGVFTPQDLPFQVHGVVPEPGALLAIGVGVLGFAARCRRR